MEVRICDSMLNSIGKSILMLFMRKCTRVNKQHKTCLFLSFTIFLIHRLKLSCLFTLFYSFPGSPSGFLYSYSWINMQRKKYFKAFRVIYKHLVNPFLLFTPEIPCIPHLRRNRGSSHAVSRHKTLQTSDTCYSSQIRELSEREGKREDWIAWVCIRTSSACHIHSSFNLLHTDHD